MKKILKLIFALLLMANFSACVSVVKPRSVTTKKIYIKKVPAQHKIIYVKGKKYTVWGGKHYRKTSRGYVYVKL